MKTALRVDGVMVLTLLGLGVGVYIYAKRGAIVDSVNPASQDNLANQAVNGVGSALVGRDWSLGSQLYDWFGNDPVEAKAPETRYTIPSDYNISGDPFQ